MIVSDFNQTVPRRTAQFAAFQALETSVLSRFLLVTGGEVGPLGVSLVDHVARTPDLQSTLVEAISRVG